MMVGFLFVLSGIILRVKLRLLPPLLLLRLGLGTELQRGDLLLLLAG
jgi:hypothetical protein